MKKSLMSLMMLGVIISFSTPAFAVGSAGFENASFSTAQLAKSGAGGALANEPAAISYNPAGITQLNGVQVQTNAHFISILNHFESNDVDNMRTTGTIIPFPTSYLTVNPGKVLGDRVVLGVGADSPFGLATKYKSQHPATRFTGYDTWLKMYAIKPVVALKLHDKLSVAAGPMYYRIYDFGTALNYPTLGVATGSQARLQTRGQNWGWHAGILAKPTEKHQLGFYFRSPVTMHLSGRLNVEGSATSGKFETAARAKMDLPLNFTWSYAYKATENTRLALDVGYTRWSSFKRLYVDHDSVGNANDDAVIDVIGKQDKDWRSGFSIQGGLEHDVNEKLTLMMGAYFYSKVVSDSTFVPGVPSGHRIAGSLGGTYSASKNIDFGMSYIAGFVLPNSIDNSLGGNETATSSVDGKYWGFIQELSVSLTYKWDGFAHEEEILERNGWMAPQGEGKSKGSFMPSWS